jgi:hypothetical protein
MDLYSAECRRTVRTYEWARAQMENEIDSDYPNVRGLGCLFADFFPDYVASLDTEDGHRLARAFATAKHSTAVRLKGDPELSKEDERLMDAFALAHRDYYQPRLLERFRRHREEPRMSVSRLSAGIIEQLSAITGAPFKRDRDAQNASRCLTRIGDWTVETGFRIVLKTGATFTELHHLVNRIDMPKDVQLGEFGCTSQPLARGRTVAWTSYPTCLGFQAMWYVPSAEAEGAAIVGMAKAAQIMHTAWPEILHGLNIDD